MVWAKRGLNFTYADRKPPLDNCISTFDSRAMTPSGNIPRILFDFLMKNSMLGLEIFCKPANIRY